jgi:diguanylate cyclase (GGDEF)-like protein
MLTAVKPETDVVAPDDEAQRPAAPDDEAQCEDARLSALDSYDILDTPAEEAFDRITRIARGVFGTPISTVTFVDGHRQWFKSRQGVLVHETCKSDSFCDVALRQDDVLVVPDALTDARFAETGLVVGPPNIRFYAGAPLRSADGHGLGALCVIDTKPRQFSSGETAILRDLADVVMRELESQKLNSTDSLTAALSRRGFRNEAQRAIALALRHKHTASCILFDIDHFKAVNDTYGHAVGDHVLVHCAQACRERLRTSDIFGRIGGEEFAVLLPHTGAAEAMKVAETLRGTIAEQKVATAEARLSITASFGVATLDRSVADIDELLRGADVALYIAKNGGRNRCTLWQCTEGSGMSGVMRRVLKAGKIAFNTGRSVVDCTVRALSDSGAEVEVVSTAGIPERFKLVIEADGLSRSCTVVRQMNRRLEVAFAGA